MPTASAGNLCSSYLVRSSKENPPWKHVLEILLSELPVKQAANLAAQMTGEKKNQLYELALKLRDNNSRPSRLDRWWALRHAPNAVILTDALPVALRRNDRPS